jgi:uncharacterized protein (DUF58 family)
MMITRVSQRILVSTIGWVLLGLVMGNMMLIYIGFIPFIYASIGFLIQSPQVYEISASEEQDELYIGDKVRVDRNLTVSEGIGPVIIYEEIPPEFRLIDGNNINIYWKGLEPIKRHYHYEYECSRRGIYKVGVIKFRGLHPLGLYPPYLSTVNNAQEIAVNLKPSIVKRVRRRQQYTLFPMPSESRIKLGTPTLDFREIRQYNYGDPYKSINWKATARLGTSPWKKPAINEYEREGKRVTWIFLDKSMRLRLGNSISNSFEYAIQAAASLTEYYIERNCRVGYAEYQTLRTESITTLWGRSIGGKEEKIARYMDVFYPESGEMQLHKIRRRLLGIQPNTDGVGLLEIIQQSRKHLQGTNPLFIIITNLNERGCSELTRAIDEMTKYTRQREPRTNIIVINVSGYALASDTAYRKMAAKALQVEEKRLLEKLSSPGVSVINWDPSTQDLVHRMTETVIYV